jgi:hypothetical protein
MKTRAIRRIPHFRRDDGQVTIFVVLALALFLLAFLGFAVDMTNLWFHRQMAQGAADAACQAGIMDVLVIAEGGVLPGAGFTPGTGFNCSGFPNSSPCKYAAFNGYNGAGLTAGVPSNEVTVSFPGTVPGSQPPPPNTLAPVPFLRTDVVDRVGLTFATLVMGQRTSDVRAFAECGLVLAKVPIPIIVLNPVCAHSFEVSSSAMLKIIGGPARSVQVNSMSTYPPGPAGCAAATSPSGNSCVGNAVIDLSQGGPNFTGSNFGTFGGQLPATPNFLPGTTGSWTPSSPISDPFAMMAAPAPPAAPSVPPSPNCNNNANPCNVNYNVDGCPDHTGCLEYGPGLYTQPIQVQNKTAIFVQGVYYLAPTTNLNVNCGKAGCTDHGPVAGQCHAVLSVDSNGVLRPSAYVPPAPNDIGGTIFYLTKDPGQPRYGSVFFGSNAGNYGGRTVDQYDPMNPAMPVRCDGAAPTPAVPLLDGNVLLAPCTGPYGDPLGVSRRMLFFQDRANNDDHGQPSMQGGGGLLLAGTLYFHNCPNSPDCTPGYPTTYNAFLQLQGTPGSSTRVIGNIIADQLIEAGNGSIDMVLDPFSVFYVLKATLLR